MSVKRLAPFLRDVDSDLSLAGFSNVPVLTSDTGTDIARWERKVTDLEANQYIDMAVVSSLPDEVMVEATIGISSHYIRNVENEARLWECGAGMLDPRCTPLKYPVVVAQISLHWLVLSASHPGVSRTMWRGYGSTVGHEAKEFLDDLFRFGGDFFERTGVLNSVVEMLLNLDDIYPSHLRVRGLYSWDELVCCAVLLHKAGRKVEAKNLLDQAVNGVLPKSVLRRSSGNPHYLQIIHCRLDKVIKHLFGRDGI